MTEVVQEREHATASGKRIRKSAKNTGGHRAVESRHMNSERSRLGVKQTKYREGVRESA